MKKDPGECPFDDINIAELTILVHSLLIGRTSFPYTDSITGDEPISRVLPESRPPTKASLSTLKRAKCGC